MHSTMEGLEIAFKDLLSTQSCTGWFHIVEATIGESSLSPGWSRRTVWEASTQDLQPTKPTYGGSGGDDHGRTYSVEERGKVPSERIMMDDRLLLDLILAL